MDMNTHSLEDQIQYRRPRKALGDSQVDPALVKKEKKRRLPTIRVEKNIVFDSGARTYHVRIARRLIKKNSPSFSTLQEAVKWRDTEQAAMPKSEQGYRKVIWKDKQV